MPIIVRLKYAFIKYIVRHLTRVISYPKEGTTFKNVWGQIVELTGYTAAGYPAHPKSRISGPSLTNGQSKSKVPKKL